MRKFKTTPQKKFVGMIILFVGIPLFILAYIFLVLKWRPGLDTVVISAAIAVLALYFYLNYKKQLALQGKAEVPLDEAPEGELSEEGELPEEELPDEGELSEEELVEDDISDESLPEEKSSKKK